MKPELFQLLERKFQVELDKHKYDMKVLLSNERAIPEHTNFVEEVVNILNAITEAKDRLDTLREVYTLKVK